MLKDLSFAVRTLLGRPALALAAVATLAVGIGATTAIFSTVNAALLRPLPYPTPDALYTLGTALTDGRFSTGLIAPSEAMALNGSTASVIKAALVRRTDTTVTGDASGSRQSQNQSTNAGPEPVQVIVYSVSEGFFDLFGLPMTLGQGFTSDHHRPFVLRFTPGGPPPVLPAQVAVLSHRVWQNQFGRDPGVIGKSLRFAYGPATIVGVASPDFDIPPGADVWTNMRADRQSVSHGYDGYLRARPGTTRERLASEMAGVMAGVAEQFPGSAAGRAYVVRPLVESIVGDLGPMLIVVLAGATLLLVLACVNVTNLLLASSAVRSHEIAVRAALGAGRGRIIRQLLTESLVLAAAGTVAGLIVALVGVRLLLNLGASTLPRLQDVPFDGRVLLVALTALLVTTVLIGLVPALRLARVDIRGLMNESGRSATGGPRTHRLLAGMVVTEIAVAITLVAGAGWLVRSFTNLSGTDPGFTAKGRLVVDIFLPAARYGQPDALTNWSASLSERLHAIGSVTAVGATSMVPLRPEHDVAYYVGTNAEADDPNRQITARLRSAGPGFFKAMGVKVMAGREFTTDDDPTGAVAVINRAFAQRYLHGNDPLKEQFYFGFPTVNRRTGYTILGVVDDMKYVSVGQPAEPTFYTQEFGLQQTIVVASSVADPTPIIASVRAAVKSIDPTLAVNPESMPQIVATSLSRQRLGLMLMMMFAGGALMLAAIGIYGVIAYASAQRLGEVATRMALGATPSDVFWMLIKQGRTLAAIGMVLGLLAAYLAGRVLASRLYEVRALDPLVLVTAVVLVLAITCVAIVVPARRASQIDLAGALRLQ
jgi:predicted permease